MSTLAFVFILALAGTRAQQPSTEYNFVCTFVDNLNCANVDYKPVCANNGVEYKTECDFTKAHCKDVTLTVVYQGRCSDFTSTAPGQSTTIHGTTVTTPAMTTATTQTATASPTSDLPPTGTASPTLSLLCQTLILQTCPDDNSPVCASNLVSYPSVCEYTKARCLLPSLTAILSGTCSQITTPLPSMNDIICNAILSSQCYDDGIILCGSDGVSYGNSCDYEKAKCTDDKLTLAYTGSCKK